MRNEPLHTMDRFIARRASDPVFARERRTGDALYYQQQLRDEAVVLHPGLKRMRDEAKKGPCWTGYHKVAGKADYADGSCAKNGESKTKKKKRRKRPSKTEKGKESSTDASSSDDEKKKKKPPSKD